MSFQNQVERYTGGETPDIKVLKSRVFHLTRVLSPFGRHLGNPVGYFMIPSRSEDSVGILTSLAWADRWTTESHNLRYYFANLSAWPILSVP